MKYFSALQREKTGENLNERSTIPSLVSLTLWYSGLSLVEVIAISIEDCLFNQAFAGDQITLTLTGCNATNIASGDILCDISVPSPVTTRFQAKVVVFANVQIPLTRGFQVVLHCKNLQKQATISKLISQLDKSTGRVTKTKPRCLAANSSGIVEIETSKPISIELYSEYKDLGRIMLRYRGATVAAGLVIDQF
ncbi:protein HBS1-like [Panonychus citri]|uniref:protein HBS1-like n=1 Tax=Panonychus citri TaxID=50023 RepID=UPI002306E0C5|nr:protein HBS1-like [Panonychus citri]